ncbi:MAG: hypothetical protein F6K39_13640 [Okeania sp. SIO3B3]|nr:hypothetical protein [Okeania sp. SIO3B3]
MRFIGIKRRKKEEGGRKKEEGGRRKSQMYQYKINILEVLVEVKIYNSLSSKISSFLFLIERKD